MGLMHEKYSQSRNIAEYEKNEFPYLKGLLLKADITPLSLMSRGMLLIRIIDMRVYLFNLSTPLISRVMEICFIKLQKEHSSSLTRLIIFQEGQRGTCI